MEPLKVSNRVFHIDALRGVAILMMLQGHFVDTLLQNEDRIGPLYDLWKFCRGHTAPVFFTTSGVILVYLLVRKPDITYRKMRLNKAYWRGLEVLMWGYLLRFNIWPFLFYGNVYNEFWRVDVLHCIGFGLLFVSLTYLVVSKVPDIFFRIALPIISIAIFLLHPWYSSLDYSSLPFGIQTYFTREAGSVFILFPFLGYLFLGGFLGSLYSALYEKRKWVFILGIFIVSVFLIYRSTWTLNQLYILTDIELFKNVSWNNFGFIKVGRVLFLYAIFMIAEPLLAKVKLLNTLGQHTLTIYIIHFVLLFGSWFGLGIDDILFDKRSLSAEQAIAGAIVFLVVVCWLTLRYHKWKDAGYALRAS